MKIDLVIPTRDRLQKLLNCLGSIQQAKELVKDEVWTYVYYSDEAHFEIDKLGYGDNLWIFPRLLTKPYRASTFWNDHLKDSTADMMFYLNDDVVLEINCIKNGIEAMREHFPDTDGVIGLRQENIPIADACQGAFGIIGKKYTERFPDKQVFCPQYERFYLDREVELYAKSINKFYYAKEAMLKHLHPAYNREWEDMTHFSVRKYLHQDKQNYILRQTKQLLWGKSFETV